MSKRLVIATNWGAVIFGLSNRCIRTAKKGAILGTFIHQENDEIYFRPTRGKRGIAYVTFGDVKIQGDEK